MSDTIPVDMELVEELEVLLRKIAIASRREEDMRDLVAGGLNEAATVFADGLEDALEEARKE